MTETAAEPLTAALVSAGEPPAPGSWRSALYREDAPGARLDGQPWARSWASFLAAVLGEDSTARNYIANAWSERIPSEGGFLVPESLRSQVMAYITPALIRPRAMVLPMATERLGLPLVDNPSQTSGAQALGGLTFSIVEPGNPIPATNPQFARAVLEAQKLAAFLQGVPNELVEDASAALGDFLARVIALGHAWYEDDLFIANGTGVGQPQSLANADCQVTVTRTNSGQPPAFLDVVAMFKALHPASKQVGLLPGVTDVAWLMSATVMDAMLELYYNPSGSEVVPPSGWFTMGDGNQIPPSMLGLPALVTDHQPAAGSTGDVILADLRHYVIGDRLEMTVERSAGGAGFASDTSQFRIRSRLDGQYLVKSQTTTQANQQVSPVVVLK